MKVELKRYTPNPDELIEACARECYDSLDKMTDNVNVEFIRSLIRKGHLSVLEHASATFKLSEISRVLTHQLVRHRIAAYSQQSQRYVKMNKFNEDEQFVIPDSFNYPELIDDYHDHMQMTQDRYDAYIKNGIPAEDARMVLPNATHTVICTTYNFREWRHFLDMRGNPHAQWEIRAMAILIWKELVKISPAVFGDYKLSKDRKSLIRSQYIDSNSYIYYKGKVYLLKDLLEHYIDAKEFGAYTLSIDGEMYPRKDMRPKGYENND